MRNPWLFLLLLMLCAPVEAAKPPPMSAQEIADYVRTNGAKATVDLLYSGARAGEWESVISHVQSGSSPWVAVAENLATGTDAGTSLDLQVSLALALPMNPRGVLRLAGTQGFLSLKDLCGAPFIEPSHSYMLKYLKRARRSLQSLHDAALQPQKAACLAQIDKAWLQETTRGKP